MTVNRRSYFSNVEWSRGEVSCFRYSLQSGLLKLLCGYNRRVSSVTKVAFIFKDSLYHVLIPHSPICMVENILKKHLEQYDIYLKFKGKKALSEADKILFKAMNTYLKGVTNGNTSLPVKGWPT